MNFDELKEKISQFAKTQWEQFQETPLYVNLHDRYENLSPIAQRLTLGGVAAALLFVLFSIPLSSLDTSAENVTEFEGKRQLIRDMLKVAREAQENPDFTPAPDLGTVEDRIRGDLQSAQLMPEQIKSIGNDDAGSKMIPRNMQRGTLQVSLAKLNLRQIVDLGYQFQAINPNIKIVDLVMQANAEDPRYFDTVYKLSILSSPVSLAAAEEPETKPSAPRKGAPKRIKPESGENEL